MAQNCRGREGAALNECDIVRGGVARIPELEWVDYVRKVLEGR